jgi:Uma2 family endonuclease
LCAEHREAVLELTANGKVLVMTPTGSETGARSSELAFQLQRFAQSGTTWKAFASSSGFRLSDDSVLSCLRACSSICSPSGRDERTPPAG